MLAAYACAKWHQYEPAQGNAYAGAVAAFGEPVNITYRFDQADRILAIDSDFLSCGPGNVRYARDFSARRRVAGAKKTMNRLYVIESTPTNTGAMADHRLSVRPSAIEGMTRAIASGVGVKANSGDQGAAGTGNNLKDTSVVDVEFTGQGANWLNALVSDLKGSQGKSIVIAGDE